MPDYIEADILTDTHANTQPNTISTKTNTYTAKAIADEMGVSDTAIRRTWWKWISQVAPVELLKDGKKYTELAHTLYGELASVDAKQRAQWVTEAKSRYAQEWASAGVIDCEVMPDEVGGTLALMSNQAGDTEEALIAALAEVDQLIDGLSTAEANFSDAELRQWAANGTKKGIQQFKVETIAQQQTLNKLRQQRLNGGNASE